jgi:hypothetical protein
MRISESKPLTGGGQIAVFMRAFGTQSTQNPTRVRASQGKLRAECPKHARFHAGSARMTRGLCRGATWPGEAESALLNAWEVCLATLERNRRKWIPISPGE